MRSIYKIGLFAFCSRDHLVLALQLKQGSASDVNAGLAASKISTALMGQMSDINALSLSDFKSLSEKDANAIFPIAAKILESSKGLFSGDTTPEYFLEVAHGIFQSFTEIQSSKYPIFKNFSIYESFKTIFIADLKKFPAHGDSVSGSAFLQPGCLDWLVARPLHSEEGGFCIFGWALTLSGLHYDGLAAVMADPSGHGLLIVFFVVTIIWTIRIFHFFGPICLAVCFPKWFRPSPNQVDPNL